MSRKSPRLAAKAKVFESPIHDAIHAARHEQQERAEFAASRIQKSDPLELYYNDRDAFFDMTDAQTMILRNKFIKNLYIQRGLFEPCKDILISYRDLQAILIKINGTNYWLFCGIILTLNDYFEDVGDVWDDSIHMAD